MVRALIVCLVASVLMPPPAAATGPSSLVRPAVHQRVPDVISVMVFRTLYVFTPYAFANVGTPGPRCSPDLAFGADPACPRACDASKQACDDKCTASLNGCIAQCPALGFACDYYCRAASYVCHANCGKAHDACTNRCGALGGKESKRIVTNGVLVP